MRPESQHYEGHRIELRVREDKPEILIDDVIARYGQLSGGLYFLHEYAYDWSDNLIDAHASPTREGSDVPCRKSYSDLTGIERDRFVQALYHLKSTGVIDQYANGHDTFFHAAHHSSHFLPWHREFLRRFEDQLRTFHPDIPIPYRNSTVDTSHTDPLRNHAFLGQFDAAWGLGRALDIGEVYLRLSPEPDKRWPERYRQAQGLMTLEECRVAGEPDMPQRQEPEREPEERLTPLSQLTAPMVALRGFWMGLHRAEPVILTFRSDQRNKAAYGVQVVERIQGETAGGTLYMVRTGHGKDG
jgi:hypothetical protein